MYDYTATPPQREFDLIPNGTIASVTMKLRPGGAGEQGLLKRSKNGECAMLDIEFVVLDGEYARRKFWANLILEGTTPGHEKAAAISRSTLRSILESARGIKPDDVSPEARAARTVDLSVFDGMNFVAKIGIETGKPKGDGTSYNDKNILTVAITPDKREWHPVAQSPAPPTNGGSAAAAGPAASNTGSAAPAAATPALISKPSWASE
jgi:hypothetical protein